MNDKTLPDLKEIKCFATHEQHKILALLYKAEQQAAERGLLQLQSNLVEQIQSLIQEWKLIRKNGS